MDTKCKYCGKKIGAVVPAPLTCWSCYKKLRTDTNVMNSSSDLDMKLDSENKNTKTCVMCKKTLPLSSFYRTGNKYRNKCKECFAIHTAQRFLDDLNVDILKTMVYKGITATELSKDINKTRKTCVHYLYYLSKSSLVYKKKINKVNTYFIRKELAEKLIERKKSGEKIKIFDMNKSINPSKKNDTPQKNTILDNSSNSIIIDKVPGKGILIKDVPISKLGFLIKEFREDMSSNFNFEIITDGDTSQIFLSEKQIFSWAYQNIEDFLKKINNIS